MGVKKIVMYEWPLFTTKIQPPCSKRTLKQRVATRLRQRAIQLENHFQVYSGQRRMHQREERMNARPVR